MYNAESPTPMLICIVHPYMESGDDSPDASAGYIQYTLWDVPVALILTICLKLRSSHIVKYKTFSNALMYICLFLSPPSHGGLSAVPRHLQR